jgi:TolB protein
VCRALALTAGIVALVGSASVRPPAPATQITRVSNAQSHPTNDEPFPSPDGSQLAIESNRTGLQQIYVISTRGSIVRRVTRDGGSDDSPAWSHDGKRIAYVLNRGDRSAIYVVDADGRHAHSITRDEGLDYLHPMWSPDDRWIMYNVNSAHSPSTFELWAMRTDGSEKHAITAFRSSETTYGSWSPDGKRIAFRRKFPPYRSQVYVANADATAAANLSNTQSYDGWPSWSPDGEWIVFSSNRRKAYRSTLEQEVFVMRSDGSDVRLASNAPGRNVEARFSVDGKQIYFSHCLHHHCEVYVIQFRRLLTLEMPPNAPGRQK